jgi:uncharacterized protein (DUF1330 family)
MVYVVAQLTIHDRERYQRYTAGFMAVLKQHGGRLLAADEPRDATRGGVNFAALPRNPPEGAGRPPLDQRSA